MAAHSAESPANAADAEFHAGWYALRGLDDAKTAARHFARIAEVAEGPISLSRAYYWLGRAAEAGGPGNAKAYYQKAARYGTTFYGQLAAERIGGKTLECRLPRSRAEPTGRISPPRGGPGDPAAARRRATRRLPTLSTANSPGS